MAMRLIGGGTLSSRFGRGRLPPARAVAILNGAATPSTTPTASGSSSVLQNILLDERERVYLADFGIAKMLEGSAKLTATGMITGTPQYMAPEQAVGTKLDARADSYELGVVAYEMLTGRVPFSADTPVGVLMKHVQEPVPVPAPGEVNEPLVGALRSGTTPPDRNPSAGTPTTAGGARTVPPPVSVAPPTTAGALATTDPARADAKPMPALARPSSDRRASVNREKAASSPAGPPPSAPRGPAS